MKPKLLLDIDGVFNPYAARGRPEGYERRWCKIDRDGARWTGELKFSENGYHIWHNPQHGAMLRALDGLVDFVWATMWEHSANTLWSPILGLPTLPVIEFPRKAYYEFGHIFKLGDVVEYIGEEPFAWLDDDFEPDDIAWAKARAADGMPTLFVQIDPAIGLRQEDLNWVEDWASRATPS